MHLKIVQDQQADNWYNQSIGVKTMATKKNPGRQRSPFIN